MPDQILQAYKLAKSRIFFLDYDGTLVPYTKIPSEATIGEGTVNILTRLASDPMNTLVIISGRDIHFLDSQFSGLKVTLVAEHGYRVKETNGKWTILPYVDLRWKARVRSLFSDMASKVPGCFIEEKEASVAFHYRSVGNATLIKIIPSVIETIESVISENTHLEILNGNKTLEVKTTGYNKGTAAVELLRQKQVDFILAAGDDVTDETLFRALRNNAFTIKVGAGNSLARFRLDNPPDLLALLAELSRTG
jgi:trehalose 6-phosphate synthase/phosphatase